MNVYSNTTPFIALASVDQLDLLPKLFGKIYVADAVVSECAEGQRILVPNLKALEWIIPVADDEVSTLPVLFELDRGEKQTIILALKYSANTVIIDERIGRRVAEYLGLKVTGTLGILAKAKSLGLIPSFSQIAMDMREQGIHYNAALITRIAKYLGEFSS